MPDRLVVALMQPAWLPDILIGAAKAAEEWPAQPWRRWARCRGEPLSTFFTRSSVERARALCRECSVVEECAGYAEHHECVGVWGGVSTEQRAQARRAAMENVQVPPVV
jgi:hypothetical protein